MLSAQDIAHVALVGTGATVVMDVWLLALQRIGIQTANFALIGRWVAHLARGRFVHHAIAEAPPFARESSLGWFTHYATGVAFAALLVAGQGIEWLRQPTFVPALAFGVVTVIAPLFVMQPAMGAGFAATKTSAPLKNCLRSVVNHAVFGSGLYVAAVVLERVSR